MRTPVAGTRPASATIPRTASDSDSGNSKESNSSGSAADVSRNRLSQLASADALASPRDGKRTRQLNRQHATIKVPIATVGRPLASLLADKAREYLASAAPDQAQALFSLPNLRGANCPVIVLGYENDLGYCDHFLSYNRQHFVNQGTNWIVVLDGLPKSFDAYGPDRCKSVPSALQDAPGVHIAALCSNPVSEVVSELQFLADMLNTLAKEKAKPAHQQMEALKSLTRKVLVDVEINLRLHSINDTFDRRDAGLLEMSLKLVGKKKSLPDLAKQLNSLAINYMQTHKKALMQAESSDDLQRKRAAQILQLVKDNPGKTVLVRAGAALAYSTQSVLTDKERSTGAASTNRTGFVDYLSTAPGQQDGCDALPLALVRSGRGDAEKISHESVRMSLGDEKVLTTDDCLAIDYTLFRASASNGSSSSSSSGRQP